MKKILLISTNAIGDTYLSMAFIHSLTKKISSFQLTIITNPESNVLFQNQNEYEVRFIENKNILNLLKLVLKFRNINFDYIFSFFPGTFNTFILLSLRAKQKAGYINLLRRHDWFKRRQNLFVKNVRYKLYHNIWTSSFNYLDLVKFALEKLNFDISKVEKPRLVDIKTKFSNSVIIHFESKEKDRSLPFNLLNTLIEVIKENFKNPLIIIGSEKISSKIPTNLFNQKKIKIIIKPELVELLELLHCKLFFAVDSFPLHIADAYNTNFVGLFSKTYPGSVLVNYDKAIKFDVDDFRKLSAKSFKYEIQNYLVKNEFI